MLTQLPAQSPCRCGVGLPWTLGCVPTLQAPQPTSTFPSSTSLSSAACAPAADRPSDQLACLELGRELNSVAVSPDGRRAVFGLQDHTLQIWDLTAQALVHILKGHKSWVNHVAYSLDGVRVASASSDKAIKLWSARAGQCERTLVGHMLSVSAVAFSDDATRLASGSWDKSVAIWDVELGGPPLLTLTGHTDWVHSVAWSPGATWLVSGSSDHSVRVWNATSGSVEQVLVGHLQTVTSVCFARSGIFVASGSLDRTVRIWNLHESTLAACMQQRTDEGAVHCIAFARDGERVVVGCSDRSVKVWNFCTGSQEARFVGHEDAVLGVCPTPDGNRLVSCSRDQTARIWVMPPIQQAGLVLPPPPKGISRSSWTPLAANSLQELHDRLRSSEDTNERLRRQLQEAQSQLVLKSDATSSGQRELNSYRELVDTLSFEKERLEKSFEALQRELRIKPQLLVSSGACTPGHGSAGEGSGPLAAMMVGPAGGNRSVVNLGRASAQKPVGLLNVTSAAGAWGPTSSGQLVPASPWTTASNGGGHTSLSVF